MLFAKTVFKNRCGLIVSRFFPFQWALPFKRECLLSDCLHSNIIPVTALCGIFDRWLTRPI